jgi:hypothetical protein
MPCPLCGTELNEAELDSALCFRCRDSKAKVRLEIYDKEDDSRIKTTDSFSEVFLGKANYKRMRRANLRHGGYD